jgi:hypothetical protein
MNDDIRQMIQVCISDGVDNQACAMSQPLSGREFAGYTSSDDPTTRIKSA